MTNTIYICTDGWTDFYRDRNEMVINCLLLYLYLGQTEKFHSFFIKTEYKYKFVFTFYPRILNNTVFLASDKRNASNIQLSVTPTSHHPPPPSHRYHQPYHDQPHCQVRHSEISQDYSHLYL